jgi:hypothetical protein
VPYAYQARITAVVMDMMKVQAQLNLTNQRCERLELELIQGIEEKRKVQNTLAAVAEQRFAQDFEELQRTVRAL